MNKKPEAESLVEKKIVYQLDGKTYKVKGLFVKTVY